MVRRMMRVRRTSVDLYPVLLRESYLDSHMSVKIDCGGSVSEFKTHVEGHEGSDGDVTRSSGPIPQLER